MLTRANKPVSFRPRYPTEKEALATHTVPFTDFIKEMLVNAQLTDEIHPLTPLKVMESLPCPIAEALTSTYPDMILDAVVGFRLMGVAKMMSTPELTKEMFRDDLYKNLQKLMGVGLLYWTSLKGLAILVIILYAWRYGTPSITTILKSPAII